MAKLNIIDIKAANAGTYEFNEGVLLPRAKNQALFDAIIAENAGKRQGTHSTLTKAEVRGGGKKPVPQKHTGNARQGSIRNPHYVGGGVVFGPKPNRNYTKKVNKEVNRLAVLTAFGAKVKDENLLVLENGLSAKKLHTKDFAAMLKTLKLVGTRVLFVFNKKEIACVKKVANIAKVQAKAWDQVSAGDILLAKKVIFQAEALDKFTARLGGNK